MDLPSAPLFTKAEPGSPREGYEVDVAEAVATRLGREVRWEFRPWSRMIPDLLAGQADAILCGQGITPERQRLVSFTRPYAVFDEAVLTLAGSSISGPNDLVGKKVLAIDGSTNLKLAHTFVGAEVIPFAAEGDDVLGDLVRELTSGAVDAVVDDEVVLHPICRDGVLKVAFSSPTANRWAIAVDPGNDELLSELDRALGSAIADGDLKRSWQRWMPEIEYPELVLQG
ncbi:substrate-binding periplasmic protein [Leucobacter sp. Z1108]|uniref:substrate-binding periplasmic protein n=1 Tax=Leucobacter sp. Z1108 TaxID=3439066 RepID=UPI003F505771